MSKYVIQETTIKVTKKTRNRLAKLGSKDETFNQIINRILDEHTGLNS